MNLKDKIVVITGASRGLGKSMAGQFAKEDCRIIVTGRTEKDLKEVSKSIDGNYVVADVTKEDDMKKVADFAVKKFGRIDIWINNAGIYTPYAPVEEMDWEKVHELFEVNFFGTVYGSKAALIQMKKQKFGTIMNIISTSGLEGRPNSSGYCATKFAQDGFTKSLRLELNSSGIKVLSVYPGGMKTVLYGQWKHPEYDSFMEPEYAVNLIIQNLKKDIPDDELIIRRPKK